MLAFEMPPTPLEMASALIVDRLRDGIGKMAFSARRIIRCRNSNGLDLDHPARAETRQDRVDLARDFVALDIGRTFESGPAKYQPAIRLPSFNRITPLATNPAYETRSANDGPEWRKERSATTISPQNLRQGVDVAR